MPGENETQMLQAPPVHLDSNAMKVEELLKSTDTFLCDFSGTIWDKKMEEGSPDYSDIIEGAKEAINMFRKAGKNKKIVYVTSSISRHRKEYVQKLKDIGFKADVEGQESSLQDVFTPGYVLANYLKARQFKKKVFLVGKTERSISEELDETGISSFWSEDFNPNIKSGLVTET